MVSLVRLIGKDPDRTTFAAAKEIAAAYRLPDPVKNPSVDCPARALMSVIIVVTIAGGIVLFACGKEIPEGMLAIGIIAAGLFAGCMVMSKSTESAP